MEAMKINGNDFFCGIGFPVGSNYCSFVAGGWGGSVVGFSSIDNMMAVDNDSASIIHFKKKRWYEFRLRVTKDRMQVWIDDELEMDANIKNADISIHPSMDMAVPLGFAAYQTYAKFRKIKIRKITPNMKETR